MNECIHFEQLMEEVRTANPDAVAIIGTENPLRILADGTEIDLGSLLEKHLPIWITAEPLQINPDGADVSRVRIYCSQRANQSLRIEMVQNEEVLTEEVELDESGSGIFEVATLTGGKITIRAAEFPVRAELFTK